MDADEKTHLLLPFFHPPAHYSYPQNPPPPYSQSVQSPPTPFTIIRFTMNPSLIAAGSQRRQGPEDSEIPDCHHCGKLFVFLKSKWCGLCLWKAQQSVDDPDMPPGPPPQHCKTCSKVYPDLESQPCGACTYQLDKPLPPLPPPFVFESTQPSTQPSTQAKPPPVVVYASDSEPERLGHTGECLFPLILLIPVNEHETHQPPSLLSYLHHHPLRDLPRSQPEASGSVR